MDFQQLMARMAELDQPVKESEKSDKDYDGDGKIESPKDEVWGSRAKAAAKSGKAFKEESEEEDEESVEENLDQLADEVQQDMDECGMGAMPMSNMNKQQDNVSMNVSMNGSGSGGIKDLMNILRNLEQGDEPHGHDHGMGLDLDKDPEPMKMIMQKEPMLGDEFANSPNVQMGQDNFPVDHGDDLHKPKNSFSDKPYRGDNPMALEGLTEKLSALYEEISGRKLDEVDVKLAQPSKGRFHGGAFGAVIDGPPEVQAIIKQMKPEDYIERNKYEKETPNRPINDPTWSTVRRMKGEQDQYNYVQRYNRDNNNLSIRQWLDKAKNKLTSLVTGKPEEKVPYKVARDKFNPDNSFVTGADQGLEKDFPTYKEAADLKKLAGM
jgi:hypothetical protein